MREHGEAPHPSPECSRSGERTVGAQQQILRSISLLALLGSAAPALATDDPAAPNHPITRWWNNVSQIPAPDETNSCTKSMGVLSKKLNTPPGSFNGKSYDYCLGGNIAQAIAERLTYSQRYLENVSLKSYHSIVSDRMGAVQLGLQGDGGNICGAPTTVKVAVGSLDSYLKCNEPKAFCDVDQVKRSVGEISEKKKLWIKYAQQGLAADLRPKDISTKISCRNMGEGAKQIVALFEKSEKACAQMLDYMNKTKSQVSDLNASLSTGCSK